MALPPNTDDIQSYDQAPDLSAPPMQIDLDPPVEAPQQIDLDAKDGNKIPNEKTSARRAIKAHIAAGADSAGVEQYTAEIATGGEDALRKQMAIAKDISLRQQKMDFIRNFAVEKGKTGKEVTDAEVQFIAGLSQEQLEQHNPSTILETEYARQYFNHQAQLNGGKNPLTVGLEKDPDATAKEIDIASATKTRQEMAKTEIENLDRKWEETSWGSAIANHLGRMIPLLENIRLHSGQGDSILPGTNLAERVQRIWTLPPDQFQTQLRADIAELEALNPLTAAKYAKAVLSFSSSDVLIDNVFGIVDATTLPYIAAGKAAVKVGKALAGKASDVKVATEIAQTRQATKEALKAGVKADATLEMKPLEETLQRAGDIPASATVTAAKDMERILAGSDPLSEASRMTQRVPTLMNIDRVMEGSQGLDREAASRLSESLINNKTALMSGIANTSKIIRLEGDALAAGIENATEKLKNFYPHLNDAVIDFRHIPAETSAGNVHQVEMQLGRTAGKQVGTAETALGKPDATLFTGARATQEAQYWAEAMYKLRPESYQLRQSGNGFYISVRAHVDETADAVRNAAIATDNVTPKGFWNTFLGWLRTPEDTLSDVNRANRHIATHGSQELHRYAKYVAEKIGSLNNKSIKKLDDFLASQRDERWMDGDTPRRGVFSQSVGQFDTEWTAFHKAPPTEKERIAYFSSVQLNDWDWMFRNLGLYRDKARQGIEKYRFAHQVADDVTGETSIVSSKFTEGRLAKEIPWNDVEDAGVFVYDGTNHTKTVLRKNSAEPGQRADIEAKVAQGYKVIQVANPIERDLAKITGTDEVIHFMVVPDVDRIPLDWFQLAYRPGGHVEYKFEHWVKQPKIRATSDGRHIYEGDEAVFNFATEAEARKFAGAMDTARVMLKDGKHDELADFLSKNLPYDVEKFSSLFAPTKLKNGDVIPPRLSMSDPIRHTISGRNTVDAHEDIARSYPNFENSIRSGYNLYGQIDKKFTSTRNETLMTVKERQGLNTHDFQLEPAALIDPLRTMNRAMANIMRGRYLNDYKIASVESWIREFGDLVKVEGKQGQDALNEIRRNPVFYLHSGQLDQLTPNQPLLAAAENSRRAVLNLLGSQSELGRGIEWAQRDLINFIYSKGGQKTSDYVAEHLLPVIEDPFRYARAVAFHSKLGLFNPVQLFLQAQTLTHVTAVAGLRPGLTGLSGASLMYRLGLNESPKVLEHFANMASKLGWKKEDFIESYTALKKTGLWNVEGEVAMRDDVFDPKMFQGMGSKFLDKGTFFFREGERLTRLASWNTAYHEWRVANPEAVLNEKAIHQILLRQNTLSVNMTRASASSWQQGPASVITQFFAYQARLMEQFLGKRLTPMEKARAFTTYSGMYGVPVGVGAATFAWPWYEDVRQAALERGYDVNSPFLRGMIEGIPSTMAYTITGNEQNYAQRLGPGGLKYFKDVFKEGKVGEIFGASPKIIMDMASAIAPVFKAVISPFVPGMADWKYTTADAINALQQISTINNVGKALYALNHHRYLSKNEQVLGPATTADALLTAVMGTQPLALTDAFIKVEIAAEQKKMQDAVKKEIVKDYRRALKEFNDGNDAEANRHLQNVHNNIIGGGFRVDELSDIMKDAVAGHETLIDQMNQKFLQNAPQSQYWDRFNQFLKTKEKQ